MTSSLRPYITALKTLGFKLDYDSVAGGVRLVQFTRPFGSRDVEVQLFGDGGHRATHMMFRDKQRLRGVIDTYPTCFTDTHGMLDAIITEATRSDNSVASPEAKP